MTFLKDFFYLVLECPPVWLSKKNCGYVFFACSAVCSCKCLSIRFRFARVRSSECSCSLLRRRHEGIMCCSPGNGIEYLSSRETFVQKAQTSPQTLARHALMATCWSKCHIHVGQENGTPGTCLLYTSPSPRDQRGSRMPSSA